MNTAADAFAAAPVAAAPVDGGAPPVVLETTAPVTPPAGDAWYSGFQNEDVKTWVQAKGFKDPASVAESALNLEKLIGHEKAGRTLVLPKEDATPEEMKAFNAKLGVPDSPDGYKLPVPEGQDGAFAKQAASWFHEAGVTPRAAEVLAAKWNEFAIEGQKAEMTQRAAQADQEFNATVTGWGKDAEANLEMGRRAAAEYLPAATPEERQTMIKQLEFAMGTGKFLQMFAKLGSNLREGAFIDGGAPAMGGMSPAEAQLKITALSGDKEWTASYLNGDKAKLAEMTKLNQIAFPQGKQ